MWLARKPQQRRRARFHRPLRLELLERRDQPAALFNLGTVLPSLNDAPVNPINLNSLGLTPAIVRSAYGFNGINFGSIAGSGAGQTIAIVTAYDHPNIENDLRMFNRTFGLPEVPRFTRAMAPGTPTDMGWSLETAMDVQWAHAIAPGADILLVHARSDRISDMIDAVDYARRQAGVSVVSMSWGAAEFTQQSLFDRVFTTPNGHDGVSFVAASGDFGASAGAMWPAASPNVLAVGGTTLQLDRAGNYVAESAWTGSGGGVSRIVTSRGGVESRQGGLRSVPDVSYAADPKGGFLVYNSVPDGYGRAGWFTVGGTSAGAPQWSGLVAIANQGREEMGLGPIVSLRSAILSMPDAAFNDITTGTNGFAAKPGFDLATGRGTPNAEIVVANLVSTNVPAAVPFVGPLPDASTVPAPSTRVPKINNTLLAILAQAAQQRPPIVFNTAFVSDGPSLNNDAPTVRGPDARSEFLPAQSIVAAATTSFTATDLSRKSGGDEEMNVPPIPGGAPAGENPGASPAPPAAPPAPGGAMAAPMPANIGPAATVATAELAASNTEPTAAPNAPVSRGRGAWALALVSLLFGGYMLRPETPERRRQPRL